MSTTKKNIHISINGKEVVNSLNGIGKAISQTNRDIKNLNKNDSDYQEQLRKHKETLAQLRAEYGRTKDEINGVPSVLNKVKSSLGGVATGMIKAFSIGAVVSTFITKVSEAKDIVVQFDQAQADLAGILQTNKAGIISLTADSLKYGATTSFTATQVSSLQLELAKLGKTKSEIKAMTKGVLDAAVAMDAELGEAAAFVGGQLNSFNESASAAGKYADILSNSTNISATSFEYLSTAIPKTSKVAAEANVSFEKMNATIGVLADQSIAAETAGTGFRNILLTAAKEGRHYEELLKDVANATDKTKKATELFGKENATVAVVLATSTQKIIDQTEALEHSAGSAAALAETKLDSIKGSATLFQSAWEGMILSIENGNGFISKATRGFIDLGTEIIGLINPTKQLSDELFDQQIAINDLVSKINSSNISQTERLRLLNELNENYPELIGQIDLEKISNDELIKSLKEVNDNYRERIALQIEVEKADSVKHSRDKITRAGLEQEAELRDKIFRIVAKNNYDILVDYNNIEDSARKVMKAMKSGGKYTGPYSEYRDVKKAVEWVNHMKSVEKEISNELTDQLEIIDEITKSKGLQTEEERERLKLEKENQNSLVNKKNEVTSGKNSDKSEKELAKEQKLAEQKRQIFENGEKEIDLLLQKISDDRLLASYTGTEREIKAIELKYKKELEKHHEHKERLLEIESAMEDEINDLKIQKMEERSIMLQDIEDLLYKSRKELEFERHLMDIVDEDERTLVMLEKTRTIAQMELEIEQEKELARIENIAENEEIILAIKEKYSLKQQQIDLAFAKGEIDLNNKKQKVTEENEAKKIEVAKMGFNVASELFNQGSGAWKASKIAETTINTYQAATQNLAAFPAPFGAIAAALVTAQGLMSVQKIVSTEVPKMPSFYYGGYTGSASDSLGGDKYGSFTGMTHADEWVMPAYMTQSPRYAQTLSWLENERKYGVSSNSAVAPASNTDNTVLIALSGSVERLSVILENGITADTRIGYEEIIKMNKLNDDIRQSQNQ